MSLILYVQCVNVLVIAHWERWAHSHQFSQLCNPQSWVMKISFVCSAIFLVCYSSRKLLYFSAFLAIVSFCIVHVCAIVCRVFIALVVPSPNSLTVDWEEVTFLNYPSSLVCHGLHHELLCWFFFGDNNICAKKHLSPSVILGV